MPVDRRVFRSPQEAIAYHRGALKGGETELHGARLWQAFHEDNPGLAPEAVEKAIRENWDELEKLPTEQAMARLVEAAGGRRQRPPPQEPAMPPEKSLFDPNADLGLGDIIQKRREARRCCAATNPGRRSA